MNDEKSRMRIARVGDVMVLGFTKDSLEYLGSMTDHFYPVPIEKFYIPAADPSGRFAPTGMMMVYADTEEEIEQKIQDIHEQMLKVDRDMRHMHKSVNDALLEQLAAALGISVEDFKKGSSDGH